ncbi:MAG: flagellar hook-basal body complex protein [Rickettsiales bacterium]|nr:flagellar hook-basal body complex protein [Rickettsiales bacterium]
MSSAGIAAVTQGMAAAESVSGKIGINLSNANTPGYKAFGNYLLSETTKYNGGVQAVSRVQADIQGEITETKNEFDYAIEGNGLLPVECNGQQKYTRSGRFEVDNKDYIKSVSGCNLLGKLYTDINQEQVTSIIKDDLVPIKLDRSPNKGKVTANVGIDVYLDAKVVPLTPNTYDLSTNNIMANGKITPDITSEFEIIDSLGVSHKAFIAFKKVAHYEYAVEMYAAPGSITTTRADQLVAAGSIKFDPKTGQGKIINYTKLPTDVLNLDASMTFKWDEANPKSGDVGADTTVNFSWNTLSEHSNYNNNIKVTSDGKLGGTLTGTNIDDKGNLIGTYTNGEQKKLAAIPVALFDDPMKLENEFGTVFSSTADSGEATLQIAGTNGAGTIVSGSLESSNVDEATSMTDLMKQQRFYSFNAKAYGIMNGMEDVLLSVIHV